MPLDPDLVDLGRVAQDHDLREPLPQERCCRPVETCPQSRQVMADDGLVDDPRTACRIPCEDDLGWEIEQLHELTNIDPWFLQQFKDMVELRKTAEMIGLRDMSHDLMRTLKRAGFGDKELSDILGVDESAVREKRHELKIRTALRDHGTFDPSPNSIPV